MHGSILNPVVADAGVGMIRRGPGRERSGDHRRTGSRFTSSRSPVPIILAVLILLWGGSSSGLAVGAQPRAAQAERGQPSAGDWFLVTFDGEAVGYEHTVEASAAADGPGSGRVRRTRTTMLRLNRGGRRLDLTSTLRTVESADGYLQEFALHRNSADGGRLERTGIRETGSDRFAISELMGGTRRSYSLRIPAQVRSPLISVWLSAEGEQAADQRYPVFFPETAGTADIRVRSRGFSSVRHHDRSQTGGLVLEYAPADDPLRRTTLVLSRGESGSGVDGVRVLCEQRKLLGGLLELRRRSPGDVLTALGAAGLEPDIVGLVLPARSRRVPGEWSRLTVVLRGRDGRVTDVPAGDFQQAEVTADGAAVVRLTRCDRDSPAIRSVLVPRRRLSATTHLPSDLTEVRSLASLCGTSGTAVDVIGRAEQLIADRIRTSPLSPELLPVADVVRRMRGDCSEHAVLLACVLRASGLETRIAGGLAMTARLSGMAAHMWVEVRVGDVWIPADSALSPDTPGSFRIRLAEWHADSEDSPLAALAPLLPVIGNATYEVTDVELSGTGG